MFATLIRRELLRQPFNVEKAERLSMLIHIWENEHPTESLPKVDEYLWRLLTDRIIEERKQQQ